MCYAFDAYATAGCMSIAALRADAMICLARISLPYLTIDYSHQLSFYDMSGERRLIPRKETSDSAAGAGHAIGEPVPMPVIPLHW